MLEALYPPQALAATPQEKHGRRIDPPDTTPPLRLVPKTALPALPPDLRGSIRRVDTGGKKYVALTFDLCELATNAKAWGDWNGRLPVIVNAASRR